ncbi:S-layer homology domain-containing protein [Paenibacillus eucommiae]|uniref:SLH domain-containing protein n=1 Tax=Paenibacillus eucommiae TaxID=1355755 RepID=A0ABS4J4R6_9BACL|nr:S-layer homology domain-containing protein [Paenibacillus eucommiae]MBP1994798.1 hypothetical protein [Paenibacillus eucommiae]
MKKHKLNKLILSSMIATSLVASPVYAELNNGSGSSVSGKVKLSFPDVKESYWGTRHITKLAIEGIIDGYEDGTYRAENSVTQQEAIVMAIRMMDLEGEVKALKETTVFPEFLGVDDFFRNYVAVALNKGLITLPEEKLNTDGSKTKWGARKATREWVAKIAIRAIGQQSIAESLASTPTSFTDNSKIDYSELGYINAAVSLKIVDGFEDGTFRPKGAVTRAQIATFLSRSQKDLAKPSSKIARGYMSSLTGDSIALMDKNGEVTNYKLSNDATFYGNKNDTKISPEAIKETYEISVVQVDGTVYMVELISDQLQMDVYEGELLATYVDKMSLALLRNNQYENYNLSQNVSITDAAGKELSLSSLVKGSQIELRKSKIAKNPEITQIVVKQVPVSKSSEGTIQTISREENALQILEASTSKSETFKFSNQAIFLFADNSSADFNSIHVGDTIAYEVVNNQIAKVIIKKQADIGITVEGTLTGIDADKTYITISKSNGEALASYFLADNVQVQIDGLTTAGVFDLEKGDVLKLDLLNNKITKITATNRSINNQYFARIVSYEPTSKFLMLEDYKGKPLAYKLSESTLLYYYSTTMPFANFGSVFTPGKRVDLQISNDKVISIRFATQMEGTISQLNLLTNDITIKGEGGQLVSFKLVQVPGVEIPNRTSSKLADLIIGDPVTITFSPDQVNISKITVNKTFLYKTILTNSTTKRVTVQNNLNTTYEYSLDQVPLVREDQTTAAFSDVLADEYIKLSFKGNVVTKAELITPIRAEITAVDAASTSITVQDFAGKSKVVGLGANYAVKGNGGTALTFANLKVGDRVQVLKDAEGKMVIQVASAFQKEFASYNNVLNQLVFKAGNAGDKNTYNLYPRAYYHKGSEVLSLTSFAANDAVMIYVLDDKIVEMSKK